MDHLNRPKRGRPKSYKTAAALKRGIERYFGSISYVDTVRGPDGKPVINMFGEPVETVVYAVPPTQEALALFLEIDPRTWRNYREQDWARDLCADAETRIRAWRSGQTSIREKTGGLQFLLKNDSGMTDTVRVEVDKPPTMAERKEILDQIRQMTEEDGI